MRLSRVLAALAVFAALSCSNEPEVEFTPGSFIEKLRILAIRAGPAEVQPGEETLLESLVVDPLAGARPLSFVWIMCDPDPTGSSASVCGSQNTSRDLSDMFGSDGGSLPPGVRIFPFGDSVYYRVPDGVFDAFPPNSPERTNGVDATFLLVAYAGLTPSDLQNPDVEKQIAIKRVRVFPKGTPRNHNPTVKDVKLGGEAFLETEPPTVKPGDTVQLSATATEDSVETYKRKLPDGKTLEEKEPMVFSWFTTAGSFDELQRESARTQADQPIAFHVPPYDQTAGGVIDLYVVLRDSRGGMDWVHRKLRVAP